MPTRKIIITNQHKLTLEEKINAEIGQPDWNVNSRIVIVPPQNKP